MKDNIPNNLYNETEAFERVVKILQDKHLKPIVGDTILTQYHLHFAHDIIGWTSDLMRYVANNTDLILRILSVIKNIPDNLESETRFTLYVKKLSDDAVSELLKNPENLSSKRKANVAVKMVTLANIMIPHQGKQTGKFTDKLNPSLKHYVNNNLLRSYSKRHQPDTINFNQYVMVGAKVVEIVLTDAIKQVQQYKQNLLDNMMHTNNASPNPI